MKLFGYYGILILVKTLMLG